MYVCMYVCMYIYVYMYIYIIGDVNLQLLAGLDGGKGGGGAGAHALDAGQATELRAMTMSQATYCYYICVRILRLLLLCVLILGGT
jgi:hypothetical protein